MKRSPMPPRTEPLRRRTPLDSQGAARRWRKRRSRTADEREAWLERVVRQAERTEFRCQAHGLHARTCPGLVPFDPNRWQYSGHHVWPRSQGGTDQTSPVLWVAADCHDRIHAHPAEATALGFLTRSAKQ